MPDEYEQGAIDALYGMAEAFDEYTEEDITKEGVITALVGAVSMIECDGDMH